MAAVLHVNPHAISSVDYGTYIGLMYTFFDLEDTYGLHVDDIDGELCIRLDKHHSDYLHLLEMLEEWYVPLGNRITMIPPLWMSTRTGS